MAGTNAGGDLLGLCSARLENEGDGGGENGVGRLGLDKHTRRAVERRDGRHVESSPAYEHSDEQCSTVIPLIDFYSRLTD